MKIEDMAKLKEPFPETDLEWRLQSCGEKNGKFWGKALAYITSRAVQDRLDEVCGPDGWQTAIRREGDAYLCTLSIRVTHEDGTTEWISRTDGADATDIEPVKGGISGAIKRCAVHFGIGRYLYNLKDGWAVINDNGQYSGKTKEGKWFKWNPPELPADALPKNYNRNIKSANNKITSQPNNSPIPDDGELVNQVMILEGYINDGNFNDSDKRRLQACIGRKDIEEIKRAIDWCKNQKSE